MDIVVGALAVLVAGLLLWLRSLFTERRAGRLEATQLRENAASWQAYVAQMQTRLGNIESAVQGARLGIMLFDPAGTVVHANPAAEEFIAGRHGPALAESRLRSLVVSSVRDGVTTHEEMEIRTPLPRILRVSAEPIGDSRWAVAYVDDITERRKVDAARKDFVANVSHELKTPLGALAILAETLGGEVEPATRRKLISRIGEQAARMTRLVDDILDLSLVEATAMEPAIVDLQKVLAGAMVTIRDLAIAKAVEVAVVGSDDSVYVYGDERQLVSAAANLMSNGVTYTAVAAPPRAVSVSTYLRGDDAILEVADTGIGLAAKHQPRIFERFYRVDSARSRETGGTGLGLAIVRHVALNHGGTVEVESEPGVGSTFRMVMPAGRSEIL